MTALDIARSQVGVKELTGQNDGIPFTRYALPGEAPAPWCARFVRWCHIQAGTPLPGNPYAIAACAALQAFMSRMGCIDVSQVPLPGDLIFLYERGKSDASPVGHHIGIVEAVDADRVHSIEGNWGDQVARVSRSLTDPSIWCYGRWPF